MRKILLTVAVMFFILLIANGQTKTVTGRVTDASGNPINGASIIVKGSNTGTTANSTGDFTLTVKNKALLEITAINYTGKEIKVGDQSFLSVTLENKTSSIQEVVVVAYGTQKKTNVTGSIATVKAVDIEDKPFSSVDKTLQGAVAGLLSSSASGAPGSATDILIRGIGSITASSSPLWVIDGVIATTGDLSSNTTTANALSSLNPDDIESISVLKDAGSAAIYGSRAANGVILVTTKKGKAGKTRLSFTTEIGKNEVAFKPTNKPMTTLQNQEIFREALINAQYAANNQEADSLILDPTNGFGFDPNWTKTNTDWFNVVTHNAAQRQYNLSLSGGDARTQFYTSGGYFKQEGLTLATGFERYNGSFSITHKPTDKITFTAGISGSSSTLSVPANSGAYANPVASQFFLQPWYTPYNTDGSVKYNDAAGEFTNSSGNFNPVAIASLDHSTDKTINFRGYVSGEVKLLDNLKFTSRYSAEYFDVNENQYRNPFYGDGSAAHGDAFAVYKRVFDYTWSNYFDYRGNLNRDKDIYFDVKAGYEAQSQKNYILEAGNTNFPEILALQYLASAATPNVAYTLPTEQATTSLFSVADLNYKDRYVVSGTFRRDGSSVFGVNKRWANFYSVGGSWNVSEESFLKSSDVVSLLKIRSSYGENGNAIGFGLYTALPTFGSGYNYGPNPGTALNNAGDSNLTWEKNKIFNIGVDFGLWKNRLTGTVEYYNRQTTSLLIYVPFSLTAGIAGQNENVGSMRNKGIEITLGGKPIVTRNFTWDITGNFAHNINKVEKLYLGDPIPNGRFEITEGHDIQEFYTRLWAGVDPANGKPLWYTDDTHSTKTSDVGQVKLTYTGKSASPKYFGSVTNTFTYQAVSLQVQFNYNFGNYVFDQWEPYTVSEGGYVGSINQLTEELTSWKKPGDVTNVPQIIFGGNNNSNRNSTRYLYKGDYIRLRNLQLGYNLPKAWLRHAHIANANLYVRGTNLFLFKNDKNIPFDPEQGVTNIGDFNVYIPKTLSVGLNIGL